SFGLHDIAELADHVPVLAVHGELHVRLEVLKLLRAHGCWSSPSTSTLALALALALALLLLLFAPPRMGGGHVGVSVTVLGRATLQTHRLHVRRGAITLVSGQPVAGVGGIQLHHRTVTGHLRQHARRRDTPADQVTLEHR